MTSRISRTARRSRRPAASSIRLPSTIPLVLLPVRLETRFQGSELWLRVYPDDVHINSFEPELTADESDARAQYLAQAQSGQDAARAAFLALAQRFGPQRAAWIASAQAQPGAKAAQWTRAAFTNVLPERWIVVGYQGNAPGQVLASRAAHRGLVAGRSSARRPGPRHRPWNALGYGLRRSHQGRHGIPHRVDAGAAARLQPRRRAGTAQHYRRCGIRQATERAASRRTTTLTAWSSYRTARRRTIPRT